MKKIKFSLILIASIGLLFACSEKEFTPPNDSIVNENDIQWNELIKTVESESKIVLVEKDGSIQEAIDAASPGDAIYIEPGIYKEALKIDKQNIRIVGISHNENEKVILENPGGKEIGVEVLVNQESVTIQNIELKDYKTNGVIIHPLEKNQLKKSNCLLSMSREDLGSGIAHYEFDIRMGNGEFDVVRIHRVVKEHRPYRPVRTYGNIFMVHGAIQDFEDIFLIAGAEKINEATSSPYYLASNNIDVWGIDLGWNRVPMETTDFSFMEDWDIEKDIEHTLKSMSIARLIRGFSRQGFCKMNLLGFSYGVSVAYGSASKETQMHRIFRNVKGLIPVDSPFKSNIEADIDEACNEAETHWTNYNSGQFAHPWGVGLIGVAQAVMANPNGHDLDATLTNIQIMNYIASNHDDGWHFLGGNPFTLSYSDSMRLPRLSLNLAPYQPLLTFYEMSACACPDKEVSFDDYIDKIKIPILYISAEGSDNRFPDYTAGLTQTRDYQRIHIKDMENPTLPAEVNFGHADLWLAYDAAELVWEPLYQWLLEH